jgi:DNA-binding winged helix-turn-helix (wHTH) protein/cytochrome c-type biogenesis protein CcmH/NrfG
VSPNSCIRFGTFELQVDTGELRKHGKKVKLPPQSARLLALLASRPGELVTREAIRKELWGDGTFVDFDHGLNFCVRQIRRALGESGKRPRFIDTLPRRGYRFRTDVHGPVNGGSTSSKGLVEISTDASAEYAEGRKQLHLMAKGSLDHAIGHFTRALELQPDYAMAHSGLGAALAMRFIHRGQKQDMLQAAQHLDRASQLDPELPEPFPWRCYIYMREGKLDAAHDAGRQAIRLLPDFAQAHYFLALVYFLYCESDPSHYQTAADHLLLAGRLHPNWQATWFVLSFIALLNGEYQHAEAFARRLIECNKKADRGPGFVGGEALMGTISLRRGQVAEALRWFGQSLQVLYGSDHMYRDGFRCLTTCGLGDAYLRERKVDQALVAYRQAWQIVQEHPTMLAKDRHGVRALAGMAAAYAALAERQRGEELLEQALEKLWDASRPQSAAAGANLAELYYAITVAQVHLGNHKAALEWLQKSVQCGWLDEAWIERDSAVLAIRACPEFVQIIQCLRTFPKLNLQL